MTSGTKQREKPNVIVFFTDQQRWDTLGLHGNALDLTPNLDRFAMQNTHVYNGFTCQPLCGPARSSMQTGLYPTVTGCYRNTHPLPSDCTTLASVFNEAGYRTGYIGKWHLAGENPVPADQRGGYRDWLASNTPELTSEPYDAVLWDNDNREVRLPGYRVDALTDAAIHYVDRHKEDAFFLFLSLLEPHQQNRLDDYVAPDGYRERYQSRNVPPDLAALGGSAHQHLGGYYGMVKRIDENFGRLLDALKSLHLLENTIVLFTSDHGCHFKTRNHLYKQSCHESSIRIPMVLGGPGFECGGQLRQLVSLIDLPPTLIDAAGLAVPHHFQGRSLIPLIRREETAWPDDVFIQISGVRTGRAVRSRRWKYSVHAPYQDGEREAGSDYYEEECLYDLETDPYELTNLVGLESHRETADRMRERLLRRMEEAGEALPAVTSASVRPGGQRRVAAQEALQ
ncbi:sulfatase-like hydrolase/transferase [Paenibacillus sp. IB182496]|uniref:Sulfatase-like hydrolase/transferase n=1 Tax=Paenibacillus sabuli TaxID=2772509 RepID=A0A927BPW6_9BACL|nr:sulfatase-like hydrolase/transferase [Paenibacillus sabuli]MBD2843575.1 sulfatase-like hydrolase/transferase [Paenibacillus sabuli]